MALFSLAAGTLVLVGALAASRRQRLLESVLLKTLGATRRQVRRIACAEYLALGTLAALAGMLLAVAAGSALTLLLFEQPLALAWGPLAALGLGIPALTLLVGSWNSVETFRHTPLELLRAE
jgi:putative ABC transport system permease protein